MKRSNNLLLAGLIILLQACATVETEVPTDQLSEGPEITQLQGTVSNIREVKKRAEFGERLGGSFLGALVGGQIGGGSTGQMMGVAGAFIGADIADKKYGDVVDRITITDDAGMEYQCLVHGHSFKLSDRVRFTLVSGHISAVIQDKSEASE